MSRHDTIWIIDNPAWGDAEAVRLSVLIPFFRDDARRLLKALDREAAGLEGAVEIVLMDDGSGDETLAAGVAAEVQALACPARFVRLAANEGRAKGRNRLAAQARGRHFLFLDSDMLPDSPWFLAAYLGLIAADDPPVAIGGFSLLQAPRRRAHALHRHLAQASDCLPADRRARAPEKYVFTSNLLIRRDVFLSEPFDEAFCGWGWEDVEWGMRIARRFAILHIDNTATHLGLDAPSALIAKYRQSAPNFARVAAVHPQIVRTYPSHRAARLLRRVPLRALWRPLLALLPLWDWAPLPLRAFSLRLYRAALYADAI